MLAALTLNPSPKGGEACPELVEGDFESGAPLRPFDPSTGSGLRAQGSGLRAQDRLLPFSENGAPGDEGRLSKHRMHPLNWKLLASKMLALQAFQNFLLSFFRQ